MPDVMLCILLHDRKDACANIAVELTFVFMNSLGSLDAFSFSVACLSCPV